MLSFHAVGFRWLFMVEKCVHTLVYLLFVSNLVKSMKCYLASVHNVCVLLECVVWATVFINPGGNDPYYNYRIH